MDQTACLESSYVAVEQQTLFSPCKPLLMYYVHFVATRQLNVTDYSFKRAAALSTEDIKRLQNKPVICCRLI